MSDIDDIDDIGRIVSKVADAFRAYGRGPETRVKPSRNAPASIRL